MRPPGLDPSPAVLPSKAFCFSILDLHKMLGLVRPTPEPTDESPRSASSAKTSSIRCGLWAAPRHGLVPVVIPEMNQRTFIRLCWIILSRALHEKRGVQRHRPVINTLARRRAHARSDAHDPDLLGGVHLPWPRGHREQKRNRPASLRLRAPDARRNSRPFNAVRVGGRGCRPCESRRHARGDAATASVRRDLHPPRRSQPPCHGRPQHEERAAADIRLQLPAEEAAAHGPTMQRSAQLATAQIRRRC